MIALQTLRSLSEEGVRGTCFLTRWGVGTILIHPQACAESKIKCSLQYPCAKCTSRGRQCVFTNHLGGSGNRNFNGSDKSASPIRSMTSQAPSSLPLFPELTSPAPDDCSRKISSSPHSPGLPELSESGTSSGASSIHSSPRSEHLETFDEPPFEFLCDFGPPEDPVFSLDHCLFPRVFSELEPASNEPINLPAMDLFASLIHSPVPLPPPTPPSNLGDLPMPTVILDYVDPLDMQRLFGAPAAMADMYREFSPSRLPFQFISPIELSALLLHALPGAGPSDPFADVEDGGYSPYFDAYLSRLRRVVREYARSHGFRAVDGLIGHCPHHRRIHERKPGPCEGNTGC